MAWLDALEGLTGVVPVEGLNGWQDGLDGLSGLGDDLAWLNGLRDRLEGLYACRMG